MIQPVRFSITASAAEKFEDEKLDSGESNIEDAGDNPATFAVVDRLKISSEPQRAASCTDSGEKCVSRVNSAGAASFMFCVYLPFSSLFWFRQWLSRARLNFSHKEIALQYYSNTKCLQNSPGNASFFVWLAGGVRALTSILMRCENSGNVSRPKTRLLFLREFPIFK